MYEERVTLWRAADANEAIRNAEAEAVTYAAGQGVVLPLFQSYELYDDIAFPENSIEVFSLIRDSTLEPSIYLSTFFDTGSEHGRDADA
jgi:predicted aminopeptidase